MDIVARQTPIDRTSFPTSLLRRGSRTVASSALLRRVGALPVDHIRDRCRGLAGHTCFTAASLVLCAGRLLLRGGLIAPPDATRAVRGSCRLTRQGMRFWRDSRLRA